MTQKNPATAKRFIPALTGLRAVCAYGIFFYHLNVFSKEQQPGLYRLMDQFYSFIPFFFVISGFVIFYTYYKQAGYKKNELWNYFVSRVARIFPLLIILNTVVFFLAYREHIYSGFEAVKLYILNITLLKGFSSVHLLTGVGPSWTNSVEEIFYLLAPVIFVVATKRYFLIKFILLFYVAGLVVTLFFINFPFEGFFSSYTFTAYFTFFGRVFEFACGIYLAMLYMGLAQNKLLERATGWTLALGIILIVASFTAQSYISMLYNIEHANEVWPGIVVNNVLLPIGIFFFLHSLLYQKTLLQRFLSTGIMVKLGNATYSFYLLHTTFVLSYINKFISKNIFISFIVMIIVAYIVYKLVEQPLARLIRKTFSKEI